MRLVPILLLPLLACACGPSDSDAPVGSTAVAKRLLADLPAAYQGADLANGRLRFAACRTCHVAIEGGANMTGPNLYGVFGRRVATYPGFDYSAALRAKSWTWDVGHLDPWLKAPRAYVPGTRMSYVGVRDDKDRRDLIAYLKLVTSGQG